MFSVLYGLQIYCSLLVIYYSGSQNTTDCKTGGHLQMSLLHEVICTQPRSTKKIALFAGGCWGFYFFKAFMQNTFYTVLKTET